MEEKEKAPIRTVGVMMLITLAGKVLGLLRDRLLTVNYGSGMEANAFLTASRIPRVFFDAVFASAISASLIPIFGETLEKKGKDSAFRFAGNFITVMALLCSVLTVLGAAFAGELTAFFADGFDAETAALCTKLTRIMMPTMVFTGVAFSFVGVLQSLGEFNITAAISLVSNAIVIIYYLTLNGRFGITGLAVAFLTAWFMQAAVQLPSLIKKRFRFYPSLRLGTEEMRKVLRLMLPVMVSTWVIPISQTVNAKFASRLFNGAGVTAVEMAYNLYTVIAGVFVLSVTNYIFPRLTRENAGGDAAALRKTVSGTMHSTLFIVAPMTAGLCVMARPIVDLVLGGGEFDAFSVGITSRALAFMALGMIGYAAQAVISRVYFAAQDGVTPLVAGGASIAVNVAVCALLTEKLDVAGVAIASASAFTVNGLILCVPLKKRGLSFFDRRFAADMIKLLTASGIMAAAAWGIRTALEGRFGKLVTLAVPTAAGVIVYAALAAILKLPEMELVAGAVRKRIGGGGGDA